MELEKVKEGPFSQLWHTSSLRADNCSLVVVATAAANNSLKVYGSEIIDVVLYKFFR